MYEKILKHIVNTIFAACASLVMITICAYVVTDLIETRQILEMRDAEIEKMRAETQRLIGGCQ